MASSRLELALNARVRLTTSAGEAVAGSVHALDEQTHTLVLRLPAAAGEGACFWGWGFVYIVLGFGVWGVGWRQSPTVVPMTTHVQHSTHPFTPNDRRTTSRRGRWAAAAVFLRRRHREHRGGLFFHGGGDREWGGGGGFGRAAGCQVGGFDGVYFGGRVEGWCSVGCVYVCVWGGCHSDVGKGAH